MRIVRDASDGLLRVQCVLAQASLERVSRSSGVVNTSKTLHDVIAAMTAASRSEPLLQISLLGEAVEHAPVGVFVFDEEGRYVAVNSFACELLGYDRAELLEHRIGELSASPEEAIRTYRAVAEGRSAEGTSRVVRKDGTEIELRFRGRETTIGGLTFYIGIAWPTAA